MTGSSQAGDILEPCRQDATRDDDPRDNTVPGDNRASGNAMPGDNRASGSAMPGDHRVQLFFRERGSGAPLVILHGLWGASENWLPVANRLSDRFRVILPDLRGHGRSPHADPMDYETMSDDVAALVESLSLPVPPALVGHSLGGKVAMTLRLTRPGLFSRVVIVDIAPRAYPPAFGEEHARLLACMERLDPSRFPTRAALTAAIHALLPGDRDRQLLLKNIRRGDRGREWKVNLPSLRAHLATLLDFPRALPPSLPGDELLFIKGELSAYIPDISSLLGTFPSARLVQVAGSGHRLHEEQPDLLARLIRRFLLEL
jgi:pimeloyl-ACP methyl ester carboxylesterase